MNDVSNPYTPPESDLLMQRPDSTSDSPLPIYTPLQVRLASFFGGPVASVYTLYQNFKQLNDDRGMRLTLMLGIGFNVFLIALMAFLPERFPRQFIPLAYSWAAGGIANSKQLTKEQIVGSTQYKRRSGWNVTAVAIVCLVAFCLVAFPLLYVLDRLGVMHLA